MARPTEFDREASLRKAMELFQRQGYSATSMNELTTAMDMRPGSIYCAFGSKQNLLIESMDFYATEGQNKIRKILMGEGLVRQGFATVFSKMIDEVVSESCPQGCLLINMLLELSPIDETVGACARKHLANLKNVFQDALVYAQEKGELDANESADELATLLIGTAYSIRIMGRATGSRSELTVLAEQTLKRIFSKSK